tara:strand:+ start:1256 stop:2020 length:765 start_codon:yes stop_codon:yes gene_type:complete
MINIYPMSKDFQILLETYPLVKAKTYLPDWYKKQKIYHKNLDAEHNEVIKKLKQRPNQLRQCPAVKDFLNDGLILRSWSDIYISKYKDEWLWEVELGMSSILKGPYEEFTFIGEHNLKQIEHTKFNSIENFGVLKLHTPYFFKTPPGIGIYFSDPFYHHRNNIRLLPAYVQTDKWHEVNLPFEFVFDMNTKEEKTLMIKAGDPLMLLRTYNINNSDTKFVLNDYDKDILDEQKNNLTLLNTVSGNWNRYKSLKT